MKMLGLMLLSLVLASQANLTKVETTFDKKTDFGALRTYRWMAGFDAINPDAHKLIVAAFEAEMSRLGFTKATTGGDVTLAYYAVARTDVDVKDLDKVQKQGDPTSLKTVGRLVAIVRGGPANQQLWTASTRDFVDPEPTRLSATIRDAAARLFETYPARPPK